jgi:hypothetical protein
MTTKKTGASRNSKVISTGLAVATGVGVVGLIGVRAAQDAEAQSADVPLSTSSDLATGQVVLSSGGYTQEQLDAYATALAQEADRLRQYRDELAVIVEQISSQQSQPLANAQSVSGSIGATSQAKPASNSKSAAKKAKAQSKAKSQSGNSNTAPAATPAPVPAAPSTPKVTAAPAPKLTVQQPAPQAQPQQQAKPQAQSKGSG